MALQTCPSCGDRNFTWSIDEETTPLTRWGCATCSYMAYEDESLERTCLSCDRKSESLLDDGEKQYWWCCYCNKVTPIGPGKLEL